MLIHTHALIASMPREAIMTINPLIGSSIRDTLDITHRLLSDLSVLLSERAPNCDPPAEGVATVIAIAAAAIKYESQSST